MAEVRAVVPDKKIRQTSIGTAEYDYLIFAAGTTTNFFGNTNLAEEAMPKKSVSEAMGLRNAILGNLERAATCATEEERQELLNVVIVGGGATGVEIAGALSQMKRYVLPYDYPEMDAGRMHIYLLEAGDRLLAGMSEDSSKKAECFLKEMGVEVCKGKMVTDYKDHQVMLKDGSSIPTRTFIWVSGVRANAIGGLEDEFLGRGGRIIVDEFNRVKGMPDVFAIGDQCIQTTDAAYPNGHPQLAQVAIQQAKNLASNLKKIAQGKDGLTPFKYKNLGSMATVGRNRAVVELGKWHTQGFIAWILWLVVHLRSILGVRNKMLVLMNWIWNYITYDDSIRILVYANKVKEVRMREERERITHLGTDLLAEQALEKAERERERAK